MTLVLTSFKKPLITDRQANFHLVFLVQLGQLAARLHMLPCHHLHGFQAQLIGASNSVCSWLRSA